MLSTRFAPTLILSVAAGFGAVLTLFMLSLATSQPWLGLHLVAHPESSLMSIKRIDPQGPATELLSPGNLVSLIADERRIDLLPSDLTEEPDTFETYEAMRGFFTRQDDIHASLRQGMVEIEINDPEGTLPASTSISPFPSRPITSLPPSFWMQVAVGLVGFWIGVWVWTLRRNEWAARFLALAGVGLMVSALPSSVYSMRELAIDGALFTILSNINHAGALIFGVSMVGLFLVYPRRLVSSRWLVLPAVVLGAWHVVDVMRWTDGPALGFHLPVALAMTTILLLVAVQYRITRGDPLARAALTWLGLSVAVAPGPSS